MRSLKNFIPLMLLVLIAGTVQAQDKTLLQTEMMAKHLELSDKQKADLDKALKSAKSDREAMQEKLKAFQEEMKRDPFVMQQAHEEQLKSILNEEQFAKWQTMNKRAKQRRMQGQRGQRFERGQLRGPRQVNAQLRRQGLQRRGHLRGLRPNPEQREALRKKWREFLEQERLEQSKKKEGDGN